MPQERVQGPTRESLTGTLIRNYGTLAHRVVTVPDYFWNVRETLRQVTFGWRWIPAGGIAGILVQSADFIRCEAGLDLQLDAREIHRRSSWPDSASAALCSAQ